MSDTPTTITADFNHNTIRRGAIPTPDGAIPTRRRSRRGMVNLQAWDAKVAADNAARGTTSESTAPDLIQLLDPTAASKMIEEIAKQPPVPPSTPPARAIDPDEEDTVETDKIPVKETRGAILEEPGQAPKPITLPDPSPTAIEAAKAALQAELEAEMAEDATPPPPPAKAAKPTARKTATNQP